ncbi:sperm axonemal maintenance protein CFAP97D1 [Myxocyprinus asiaticus]|uniref:sperm axonemal maintenance protein CFAP97D1 n=1 Tax=Myxocyprinus asiaticus TaxID=70543 RepID=UPI0022236DF5|nr:sperm axonemal maintenance protein CFAP97D1 [Myxocyprinus asiaticus]
MSAMLTKIIAHLEDLALQVESARLRRSKVMQHQAYQPILPCANKYLQYRWDKNCYDMHRDKVKSAKPTINATSPKTYDHLLVKLKKQQLEEERVSRIKRENHMLLDKMSHIMQTVGGVDSKNDYVKKSLNRDKRQLELLQITKENQRILQRLSSCRPHYSIQVWHEQWFKNLELIDSIGRYPRLYSSQGSSLPPILAVRHGTVHSNRVNNQKTARNAHEEPAGIRNEVAQQNERECDEKTKYEDNVASEDEA